MVAKIISLIISIVYLVSAYIFDVFSLVPIFVYLFFSLSFIWFGETIGRYTGPIIIRAWVGQITRPSPSWLVKFMGWVLLILPAIIMIINHLVLT